MTNAPERIWVSETPSQNLPYPEERRGAWTTNVGQYGNQVEYIRADLCRPEPQGWQPIETAPEEELVYVFGRHECGSPWWNIGRRYGTEWDMIWIGTIDPTYWMPLPEPPKP